MKKAAFFSDRPEKIGHVYGKGREERIAEIADLYPEIVTSDNFGEHADALKDLEAIFSTWGMWSVEAHLDRLPKLGALFYAAGSVRRFMPLMERGIVVVSGWGANAVSVAEFTLAQILLSCKGYFRNAREFKERRRGGGVSRGRGVFGETIAVIGAGMVGRTLIGLLKHHALEVVVVDPYLSDADAADLGVRRTSLDEAFETACVISNHAPNTPETVNMLHGGLFAKMRDDATFINTGRGATVDETALVRELKRRPTLTALLDVTQPEPPAPDSELYDLPNARLSTHIAGAINDETLRLADYCIEEFLRWEDGRPLRYAVPLDRLKIMA